MIFITTNAVRNHQSRIKAKLAAAVTYLQAADDKLGQAANEFDEDTERCIGMAELTEARLTARAVARMLNVQARVPSRFVCQAIAGHANENERNTPHIEAAIIAFRLAEESLENALDLAQQLDGEEIDAAHETPYAAWCIVRQVFTMLGCLTLLFNHDEAMEVIAGSKRTLIAS